MRVERQENGVWVAAIEDDGKEGGKSLKGKGERMNEEGMGKDERGEQKGCWERSGG